MTSVPGFKLSATRGRGAWWLFAVTAAAMSILLPWLSAEYGMTWDEEFRSTHGTRVVSFYRGELSASDFPEDGSHQYGALFDVTANGVHHLLGGDLWMVRHRVNAAFGAVGIVATGLVAALLLTPSAGVLAMVLIALSPRYFGHAMNNPKDIPFAALCMLALLSFLLLRREPPFLSWRRAVVIGIALALPLGVRPGALLYFMYFGVCVLVLIVGSRLWEVRAIGSVSSRVLVVGLVMLVAGCLLWPWALQNPLVRPIQALRGAGDFNWPGTILFKGAEIAAKDPPLSYLPTWMAITIPPVVLAGLVLAVVAAIRDVRYRRAGLIGMWGVAAFPVLAAIIAQSTLYDGWRHLLFVYPPLIILSSAGWHFLINERQPNRVRMISIALLLVGCLEPLTFMARNHPNEVVYFNTLVGGPRKARWRFDLDYWGNSLLQATEWSARLATRSGTPLRISGHPYAIVKGNAQRFTSLSPEPPSREAHHIELMLARGARASLRRLAARQDILHVIKTADGAPLAYVVPGPRFDEVRHRLKDVTPGTLDLPGHEDH
jgi:4-amino-4-deoxy-L-arabinose transferase-like glycosyltransferase